MTERQLARIKELLKTRPQCQLVTGVTGLVTCDNMAIEVCRDGVLLSVIHPLSFLDLCEGDE